MKIPGPIAALLRDWVKAGLVRAGKVRWLGLSETGPPATSRPWAPDEKSARPRCRFTATQDRL